MREEVDCGKVDWNKYGLGAHQTSIQRAAQRCLVGQQTELEASSFLGGLPKVDRDFSWPSKDGCSLDFVAQLDCAAIDVLPFEQGHLLFFYDNRHWGYSKKDRGHAVVIHQQGEIQTTETDLPEYEVKSLFGLRKRTVRPKVYQKIWLTFSANWSYPSPERGELTFETEVDEEAYSEFFWKDERLVQLGGFPQPIQSDDMEQNSAEALEFGSPEDWQLLLQLFEVGDMMWGDAGALFWFIHRDDLRSARLDRVWMVTQCH